MVGAYRNSQLSQLRACPFSYAETYVRGNPGLPSPSLQAGSAVHAAISEVVRQVVSGRTGLDVYEIAFRTAQGGHVEYTDALQVLIRFQEALGVEFEIDPRAVFLLEERLEMPITLPDGAVATYFGTPDLAERVGKAAARITDWKTHWHPESEEEFRADPQLKRYALLVAHHFPAFERFELVKRFVRYRDNYHTEVVTREDLEQVRLRLAAEIQAARAAEARGDFPATPGAWCGVCQHHASCPRILQYREHGIDDLSIADDDAARRLAGDAVALDAFAARLKDQVKRYLGVDHATGRVTLAGGEYGYVPVEKREADVAELEQVFQGAGAELPHDVLRVDLQALDTLKRRLPETLVQRIDGVVRTWQSSECRFRRTPKSATTTSTAAAAPQESLF